MNPSSSPASAAAAAACDALTKSLTSARNGPSAHQVTVVSFTTRSRSASGRTPRRWCSSRRRFVRAWASVESGQNNPAMCWRSCGAPAWTRRYPSSPSMRVDRPRSSTLPCTATRCSPSIRSSSILVRPRRSMLTPGKPGAAAPARCARSVHCGAAPSATGGSGGGGRGHGGDRRKVPVGGIRPCAKRPAPRQRGPATASGGPGGSCSSSSDSPDTAPGEHAGSLHDDVPPPS